ncbi:4-hydroxybenzoyl-CoA reductase subunit beta [Burkholderiaceae bacterium FT117]|uniref:4-hydroxybenzoyl-CoA reductase subunit beta n=1 Tax=Zeimonas sediminis TaxID=2944268 RepID=UPI00234302F0|nr:4-hydroxybenzoyl-CoA reductase subunit beta [Zeimonas sediminis]MCM5569042.1 4-hydroxybenzoyl-CoA reductase subunit beta [Zeimonas sediminis]
MEALHEFELRRPASLAEAAAILAGMPGARLIAGGTGLLPNLRRGIERPAVLVDLGGLSGFDSIEFDELGLRLGAGTTLARIAADQALARSWPAIAEAAAAVGAPAHRSVATLGGNLCLDTRCVYYNQSEWWRAANGYCLKRGGDTCHVAPQGERCHAAYSGDLAPALLVHGAEAELVSARGMRVVPLAQLFRDDGAAHLTVAPDEILASVRVPPAPDGLRSAYRKVATRGAIDFPLAGVACAVELDERGALGFLRVALTGTNSHPLVVSGTQALLGREVDEAALAALGKMVQKQVGPMRTTVTPSNYRRQVAAVAARRLLAELAAASRPDAPPASGQEHA